MPVFLLLGGEYQGWEMLILLTWSKNMTHSCLAFPVRTSPVRAAGQRPLNWGSATAHNVPSPSRATSLSRSQRTFASLSRKLSYMSEILLSVVKRKKNVTRKICCAGNKREGLLAGPGPCVEL